MSIFSASLAPAGGLQLQKIGKGGSRSAVPAKELSFKDMLYYGLPRMGLSREVFEFRLRNIPNFWRGARRVLMARWLRIPTHYGTLSVSKVCADGTVIDFGVASMRVVTTAGVNYLVDALQNSVEPENFKYHGYGTGTTAEAAGDTALVTELTTEYATDSTRPTGSQTEGASANIYRSVATLSPDSGGTIAVTEHGLFSASSSGTLLDRSKFSAINLVAGSDSLQTTYDLTLSSGG